MNNSDSKKQAVARAAIDFVEYDDVIGVGTGSTVDFFIDFLKPLKNKTDRKPDYFLHETDDWLVFPHELDGLTIDEMINQKPALEKIIDKIVPVLKNTK